MKLEEYLLGAYPGQNLREAQTAFAKKIGVKSWRTVDRYRRFQRFPSPESIARIRDATDGLVTADDHMPPEYRAAQGAKRKPEACA
jgi:hypothetical protein